MESVDDFFVLSGGSCRQIPALAYRGGSWRRDNFPALAFVMRVGADWLLLDTGYGPQFFAATESGWPRAYRTATPVTLPSGGSIAGRLDELGISRERLTIVLSHFHGDHIGALVDLPAAPVYADRDALSTLRALRAFDRTRRAFLPLCLPDDIDSRLIDLGRLARRRPPAPLASIFPSAAALPIPGPSDSAVWAVPLPGHAVGQWGLYFYYRSEPFFLVADALWNRDQLRRRAPVGWGARTIAHDAPSYRRTAEALFALARIAPEVEICPGHCPEVLRRWGAPR